MIGYSRAPAASAILVAVILAIASPAWGQVTYQNDSLASEGDGVVSCGFLVGEKFASVFVPDAAHYPFLIDEVQFMLAPYRQEGSDCVEATPRESVNVTVEIWNDAAPSVDPDTIPVYQSSGWSVSSSSTTLNALSIGDSEDILIESGVVRVAVTIPELDTMPVRDIDGITSERNLIHLDSGSWSWADSLGVTGDWLLRLVVIPQGSDAGDVLEPSPDASEDPAGDGIDAADDVPADMETDAPADADDDQGEGRLGGGGCSCTHVDAGQGQALLSLLVLLVALVLIHPGSRNRPV